METVKTKKSDMGKISEERKAELSFNLDHAQWIKRWGFDFIQLYGGRLKSNKKSQNKFNESHLKVTMNENWS